MDVRASWQGFGSGSSGLLFGIGRLSGDREVRKSVRIELACPPRIFCHARVLRLLTQLCAWIEPGRLARLVSILTCLPLPIWGGRARGQEEARHSLHLRTSGELVERRMDSERAPASARAGSGPSSRAAVRSHARFVAEFMAEIGGRRHRVDGDIPKSKAGRGRLYVTLHVGNWIVGARYLSEHTGTVHSVAGVQLRASWRRPLEARLRELGIRVHGGRGVAPALLSALRAGETVALHLDGDPGIESSARSGSRLRGMRSAALLATRSRADVWFAVCRRSGEGRFCFEARELVPPAAQSAERVEAWKAIFLRLTREEIEHHPEDWLIFRPLLLTSKGPL